MNFMTIVNYIKDKDFRFLINKKAGLYNNKSDEEIIRRTYKATTGKELNLENPKTLCDKLNWLKLNYRKNIFTTMVDKYEAKKYVADIIGEEHIIKTFGVYNNFDEIDFDKLPDQFVLKCTHDSGSFIVVTDKNKMDKKAARKKLNKRVKFDYYMNCREWPYKNVKRRIIAEEYIPYLADPQHLEYKVTCLNGEVSFVTICQGAAHKSLEERTNNHYNKDFIEQKWYTFYKNANKTFEKPECWDDLIKFSEMLSKESPYLRCDFYIIDNKILFGELTFYTWGGYLVFEPEEQDLILGEMLKLPERLIEE